jgi:type IV pilus assembly protein PilB
MPISEALRETIGSKATAAAIRAQAVKEGMTTLRMSGIEKIKQGITTVEEVSRETE